MPAPGPWGRRIVLLTVAILAITGFSEILLGLAGRVLGFTLTSIASSRGERAYTAIAGLAGFLSLYAWALGRRALLLASLAASALLRHIIPVVGAVIVSAEIRPDAAFVYNSVLAWLSIYSMGATAHGALPEPPRGEGSG